MKGTAAWELEAPATYGAQAEALAAVWFGKSEKLDTTCLALLVCAVSAVTQQNTGFKEYPVGRLSAEPQP